MKETKLNCLIVDDEPLALALIESYVLRTPFLELKGKCNSAFEALEHLNTQPIDVVFLDIQMPELSGIELSRTVQKTTRVIFTTAFDQYALEGFKVEALDYLLKPFNFEEFLTAANKAKEWFTLLRNQFTTASTANRSYIFVKSEYKQVRINFNEILYIEGLKDYVKIWLSSQPRPVLSLMNLKSLEDELPGNQFMRVHRSYIIALDKIQSVERGQVLINGERITVADQYKQSFQEFVTGA